MVWLQVMILRCIKQLILKEIVQLEKHDNCFLVNFYQTKSICSWLMRWFREGGKGSARWYCICGDPCHEHATKWHALISDLWSPCIFWPPAHVGPLIIFHFLLKHIPLLTFQIMQFVVFLLVKVNPSGWQHHAFHTASGTLHSHHLSPPQPHVGCPIFFTPSPNSCYHC